MPRISNQYQSFVSLEPSQSNSYFISSREQLDQNVKNFLDKWWERKGQAEVFTDKNFQNLSIEDQRTIIKNANSWKKIGQVSLIICSIAAVLLLGGVTVPFWMNIGASSLKTAWLISLGITAPVLLGGCGGLFISGLIQNDWAREKRVVHSQQNSETSFKFFLKHYLADDQFNQLSPEDLKSVEIHQIYEYWADRIRMIYPHHPEPREDLNEGQISYIFKAFRLGVTRDFEGVHRKFSI